MTRTKLLLVAALAISGMWLVTSGIGDATPPADADTRILACPTTR